MTSRAIDFLRHRMAGPTRAHRIARITTVFVGFGGILSLTPYHVWATVAFTAGVVVPSEWIVSRRAWDAVGRPANITRVLIGMIAVSLFGVTTIALAPLFPAIAPIGAVLPLSTALVTARHVMGATRSTPPRSKASWRAIGIGVGSGAAGGVIAAQIAPLGRSSILSPDDSVSVLSVLALAGAVLVVEVAFREYLQPLVKKVDPAIQPFWQGLIYGCIMATTLLSAVVLGVFGLILAAARDKVGSMIPTAAAAVALYVLWFALA